MKQIDINLPERSYKIYVGRNSIENLPTLLKSIKNVSQIAIITTPPVAELYLDEMLNRLKEYSQVKYFIVPVGEAYKSLAQAEEIYSWLIQNNYERNSTIISFGGGVVGDLTGFVAATYLRGVNLVHIPTTLLAQVDASIGGKVGVNHKLGKNLIGAFYQPKFVLTDVNFLKSLDDKEFECGMGEVVKYALIIDPELFDLLEKNFVNINKHNTDLVEKIVTICAHHKANIVAEDEKERGKRAILNFGHTFGHALESFYGYHKLSHGQAVLMGMKCAVYTSLQLGLIKKNLAQKIFDLINQFRIKLPSKLSSMDINKLNLFMKRDKKMEMGKLNFILIRDVGNVFKYVLTDIRIVSEAFNILNHDE